MVDGKSIPQQPKPSGGIPLSGCLYIIILTALTCISVKGCKMMNMKYEEQKVRHEIVMDSLNKARIDTVNYRGK